VGGCEQAELEGEMRMLEAKRGLESSAEMSEEM